MKTVEYEHYLASTLAENHPKIILSILFQRFMLKFQSISSSIKYDTRSTVDPNFLYQKLTEIHVYTNNYPKMKVKYATQLLSQRVAAAIMIAIVNNILLALFFY